MPDLSPDELLVRIKALVAELEAGIGHDGTAIRTGEWLAGEVKALDKALTDGKHQVPEAWLSPFTPPPQCICSYTVGRTTPLARIPVLQCLADHARLDAAIAAAGI